MQTSKEWWDKTKANPAALNDWLVKQHRGEVTAAARITSFADGYAKTSKDARTLAVIAKQEERHASWVLSLLTTRGIAPNVGQAEERYWQEMLPTIESFETGAAVGAHAEKMRLERIRVIVNDEDAPADIRHVFAMILPEEEFHERAFRRMAGDNAMEIVQPSHDRGMELLGLVS